jgi:hypothetical protein
MKNSLIIAAVSGMLLSSAGIAFAGDAPNPDKEAPADKHGCKGKSSCKGQNGCKSEKHSCKSQSACKGPSGCKSK